MCEKPVSARAAGKLIQNYFRQSFESQVAGRSPACFLVTFCTTQKVTIRSPSQGDSRFCKPRISTPKHQLRTNKIKTFPKGASRFCKLRISPPKQPIRTNQIKSFCASRYYRRRCRLLYCLRQPIAALGCISRRPCRLFCCCRNSIRRFAAIMAAKPQWRSLSGTFPSFL